MIRSDLKTKCVLLLLSLLAAPYAWADFTQWSPDREVSEPKDVSLTLNVAGAAQFGYRRAWVREGKVQGDSGRAAQVTQTTVYISGEQYFGDIRIAEAIEKIGWEQSTALARTKTWIYWKDRIVDPSDQGTFSYYGVVLKWIAFPHTAQNGQKHQCASFTADGRGERFRVSGFWCVRSQRPLNGADVSAFANAIGYKDILRPRPISVLPGL